MTLRATTPTGLILAADVPKPGDVLGGKYRIERLLGSGGMGVVYEVSHLVMTRSRFAIKWWLPVESNASDATRRFKREAKISGAIRHPNVVEVYDVNLDDSGAYLVMELLDGESLADRIARAGPLPVADACQIVDSALAGVAAAHAAGVIHRDLKPANIYLSRTDAAGVRPKVLDFGISHALSRSCLAETSDQSNGIALTGTPAYMAPEQLRNEPCGPRTDVYALGVTLYEALSGRRPFDARSYADLVVKILTGAAPALRQRVPELPVGLVKVVERAMHRDADQRFETAESFACALRPYTSAEAPARQTPPTRARRWLWIAVAAAGATALWLRSTPRTASEPTAQHEAPRTPAVHSPDLPLEIPPGEPALRAPPPPKAEPPEQPPVRTADAETAQARRPPIVGAARAKAPKLRPANDPEASASQPDREPAPPPEPARSAVGMPKPEPLFNEF